MTIEQNKHETAERIAVKKAYRVTLFIIDTDECGADEIRSVIENTKYPNRCIAPDVKNIEGVEIGEWSDDHPLNKKDTADAEYHRLFPEPRVAATERDNALLLKWVDEKNARIQEPEEERDNVLRILNSSPPINIAPGEIAVNAKDLTKTLKERNDAQQETVDLRKKLNASRVNHTETIKRLVDLVREVIKTADK